MKPIGSETIGSPKAEPEGLRPIGARLGEIGSAEQRPPSQPAGRAHLVIPVQMAAEIMIRSPLENLKALQSRLKSYGVNTNVRKETRWKTDPQTGQSQMSFETMGLDFSLSPDCDLLSARRVIAAALAPAPSDQIENWLGELALLTKHQNRDPVSIRGIVGLYIAKLQAYPGDIVRETLTNLKQEWFPAWPMLQAELDRATKARRMIAERLERAA